MKNASGLIKSLNPITTLIMSFCMVIVSFFILPIYALYEFCFIIFLVIVSDTYKKFFKKFTGVLFLILMICAVQSFLVADENIVWQYGFLKLYEAGFNRGIRLAAKIVIISGSFLWFFEVTPIKSLVTVLVQRGMSHSAAYVILSSFHMVSQMSKKSKIIMDAQRSRGMETEGNIFIRLKAFLPSLGPLIISSLLSTEERALTLEARGFSSSVKKTSLLHITSSPIDTVIQIIFILASIGIIMTGVTSWIK